MFHRLARQFLPTLFFIAASALSMGASGQIHLKTSTSTASVQTEHVRAELVAQAPEGVGPGKPLQLGLLITHQPDWHTYWKNPGDSGLPTQLAWQLPAGMDAGEIAWPVPRKIPIGHLANYGYEGTVLLPVPVTVSPAFNPGPLASEVTLRLKASWLVCRQECIPEEGDFTLQLPIAGTTALHAAAFDAAARSHPVPLAMKDGSGARVEGDALLLRVAGLPVALQGKTFDVFPETTGVIETAATPTQQWEGAVWTARLPLSRERSEGPDPLPVVLAHGGQGWRAELPVAGGWPAVAVATGMSPALEAALKANAAKVQAMPATPAPLGSWLAALAGALLGGLILNLMPCVFPVLAIKVVGFARHAQDRRAHRVSGLAYTAGVLLSFLLLGALMLALRAAGEAVGWGFQLQSPAVVATLAALFTLIALNLGGMFEFRAMLPSRLANLQARHPVLDAFLTGVLAVAVASPCTAPFMGASLGLTATLPGPQALSIFVALGLGLALPYLLASWLPAFARALPRPGAWMETLRRFLAFPMLATVVWLVWVLGQQAGIHGAAALLALLVLLAMAVWSLTLRGASRAVLAMLSIAACLWGLWAWGPRIVEIEAAPSAMARAEGAASWQPWRPGLADELLAQGRPVFVDYTAAWCVTCQYNKSTTLARPEVLGDFNRRNVALLRADWTRRDPDISAALAQLGRSGVPVYVLHAPGRAPVVFSEILNADALRAAVAELPG
ncbi:MAG: thioredoxin family protein [Proteobacteria bacterium]|nr:thioredoxin family protein [Pseudomonadota bacterium]